MTLKDIQERNQKFQLKAASLVDLIPGGGFLDASTALIRCVRLTDKYLLKAHKLIDDKLILEYNNDDIGPYHKVYQLELNQIFYDFIVKTIEKTIITSRGDKKF